MEIANPDGHRFAPVCAVPATRRAESPARMPAVALDLAAVRADDALLDLLGCAGHTPADADGTLASCLAAWRDEVHADSRRSLLTTESAEAVVSAACRYQGGSR